MNKEEKKRYRKEYFKKYYEKNKEKLLEKIRIRQKGYYEEKKEYYNEYSKKYYKENRQYFLHYYMKLYDNKKRTVNCATVGLTEVKYDDKLLIEFEEN
jgi:hypothetical protein